MKKFRIKLSFFGVIVRNFLIFSGSIFVLISLFFMSVLILIAFRMDTLSTYTSLEYEKMLINEDYKAIKETMSEEDKSYFLVYDDKGSIIYRSTENMSFDLDYQMASYIPNAKEVATVEREKYRGSNNQSYIVVTFTYKNKSDVISKIIADENYNIVFSDNRNIKKKYEEKEFDLLTGIYEEEYYVTRLPFKTEDGKQYTALYFTNIQRNKTIVANIIEILKYSGVIFIIVFIIAVSLFLISIDKKVKKPIDLLQSRINDFNNKETRKRVEYRGPREFEEIFESFNKLSEELKASEDSRIEAENERRQMLSDISHDLKTPITVIQGFAKAIIDEKVAESERKRYLETIYLKSEYLAELISKFSEYNKLERPDFSLDIRTVNICEYSRDYLIEIYDEIENLGFNLDVDIPESEIMCNIDLFQFRRVYENIIFNSVKYNIAGTTIKFYLRNHDDSVIIAIWDNGVGISDDLRNKIFKPFTMEDKSRSNNGSGLGMSIVEKIIRAHKGSIRLIGKTEEFSMGIEIKIPKEQ